MSDITLLNANDVFSGEISTEQLETIWKETPDVITQSLMHFKKEYRDLNKEYNNGLRNNPESYPPDWYDYYVYPFSVAIYTLEDIMSDDEDSSEDDYYSDDD